MHHPTDKIAHTMAFVTPVVEHFFAQDAEHVCKYMCVCVYIY